MRARAGILALAAWTLSCGGSQKTDRHKPAADDPAFTISVWIESDARMPKDVVMKGCAAWRAKRVACVEAKDPWLADVRVFADDGECVIKDDKGTPDPKDDKTKTTLAWAYSGGDIKMMMRCLDHDAKGAYDMHQFAAVVTHEVGHQIGIWKHVPYAPTCENAQVHPTDRKVCGVAVMNPYYDPKVDYVTHVDALAFDVRDKRYSVLADDAPAKDTPDCRYEPSSAP